MSGRATLVQAKTQAEGSTFVNSFLSEITRSKGVGPSVARVALASRTTDGVVDLDAEEVPPPADASAIVVVGSGNLGLVWFTGHDHRLTLEELEELHPGLLATLVDHPGVGAADGAFEPSSARWRSTATASATSTRTASRARTRRLLFGEHTIMSLKREDAMTHAPDILLLSQYDAELGEVAAFEELIGSHGGLGGPQTEPFILHPVEWKLDEDVPARRAGDLPQHPALARVDRDHARASRSPRPTRRRARARRLQRARSSAAFARPRRPWRPAQPSRRIPA